MRRPRVGDALNRVRGPFNVNGAGASPPAIAAIEDVAHIDRAVAHNETGSPGWRTEIAALGLEVTPSVGNFLLHAFPAMPPKREPPIEFLSARGLILRAVAAYGLPQCLRITIGTEEANARSSSRRSPSS